MIGWVAQDSVWPLFDGWCVEHSIDPGELPFSRALNLIYHFAVRNASQEKKREFDDAMARAVSTFKMQELAAARVNALRSTEKAKNDDTVPEVPDSNARKRKSKLPPRPAGWGDDLTVTRQSLAVAQSLKVGGNAQKNLR